VPKGVTLLEFEGVYQKEEQPEESKVLADEGVSKEELPECPDHRPLLF
jgi:hypothetical protein